MLWVGMGLGVLLLAVVVLYNQLVRARIKVRQAWAQVDAQLQRRHDLIPNLVATVAAYGDHERGALEAVARARAAALRVEDPVERGAAEDLLGAALDRLLVIAEDNPTLQADATFGHLQDELVTTEDRLAFARDFASDRVARYRQLTDTVPGRFIAGPLRFPREDLFALESERARHRPDVQLGR